jgi:hypothetical protein
MTNPTHSGADAAAYPRHTYRRPPQSRRSRPENRAAVRKLAPGFLRKKAAPRARPEALQVTETHQESVTYFWGSALGYTVAPNSGDLADGGVDRSTRKNVGGWLLNKGGRYLDMFNSDELNHVAIGGTETRTLDRKFAHDHPGDTGFTLDLIDTALLTDGQMKGVSGKYNGFVLDLHGDPHNPVTGFESPATFAELLALAPLVKPYLAEGGWVAVANCYGRIDPTSLAALKEAYGVNEIITSSGTAVRFDAYNGHYTDSPGTWIKK